MRIMDYSTFFRHLLLYSVGMHRNITKPWRGFQNGIAIFILLMIVIVVFSIKHIAKQKSEHSEHIPDNSVDSLNPPADFSLEMREEIQKIANFCGVRYVTQADIQKFTIHKISEDFSAIPGWDIWDSSIHEASGQYDRMSRATLDKEISVLSYDPQYRLAKIQGKTAVYLTSYKRCSCPDYRKRRLPCKHMYALAMELDGDVERCIFDSEHPPLYGLTLALAGHLPKSSNGVGGIRAEITERSGIWSEKIECDSSAVVMGTDPSAARVSRAEGFDMDVLSPELIKNIFTAK